MDFIDQDDCEASAHPRDSTQVTQPEPSTQMGMLSSRAPQPTSDGRKLGHGAKSDAVREQAILALLCERSIRSAADRCGLGERTLRTWLAEDTTFKAEFEAARRATYEAGLRRIKTLTESAAATLADLLDPAQPPAVRLGAARTVLEVAVQQHDVEQKAAEIAKIPQTIIINMRVSPTAVCAP